MERLNELSTVQTIREHLLPVGDLTTNGQGINSDAEPLVYQPPRIDVEVPGVKWEGLLGQAKAVIRLPEPSRWNGKVIIGATPAVRNEFSLDLLLSDIVLQRGYAFAACDKGTPNITLRDPKRSIGEWESHYQLLTKMTQQLANEFYDRPVARTYISGVSNGGYITRMMLERHPELFDGGVEWEGVLWHPDSQHLLRELPIYLANYPLYRNWRGDRTQHEKNAAYERMTAAGLHPLSEPYWEQYYMMYWIISLWLYGFNLDPSWRPFLAEWNNDWLKDPSELADYPIEMRLGMIQEKIASISIFGDLQKPLLSVAGNWDCLVPFEHHARAYEELIKVKGNSSLHRLYEIPRGNHVDGLLRTQLGRQQPVQPFYEAAIFHLEDWVENKILPPSSGIYEHIIDFTNDFPLRSRVEEKRDGG